MSSRVLLPALRRTLSLSVLAALLFTAGGCTMAPTYRRPDAPIPNTYAQEGEEGQGMNLPWKDFFKDPPLQRVVELALANNRDLRVALLNIEKTRALYRVQRADLLPTIAGTAEANNQRLPADVSNTGQSGVFRQYSASLGFSSFELDLFGRVRSLTQQALETFYSVENDAQTARLSLEAETAGMYLQLVADRELLDITKATYKNRKDQYEMIQRRFESGVASLLETNQAKSIMEEARANAARYEAMAGQDANSLTLLMGTAIPEDLPMVRRLEQVQSLEDVPAGLPSLMLERRPDIQAAEHRLKGANASIGAARANFFPTITLTGAIGTLSTDYDNLFTGPARTWSFLPQVSLPIFDTGRNISRLQASEADRDIAVAQYEKAVQTAFREVGDALVQRLHIGEQLDAESSLLNATKKSYELAMARYQVGVDSYLNLLDAERSLYSARQSYLSTRLLRENNALTLYKALGGGWEE